MARKSKAQLDAEELCSKLPEPKRSFAVELVLDLQFLQKKMAECRKQASGLPPVSDYDNGGGQSGVRVDPWVNAHKSLSADYRAALKQLTEILDATGDEDVKTSLASFRSGFSTLAFNGKKTA